MIQEVSSLPPSPGDGASLPLGASAMAGGEVGDEEEGVFRQGEAHLLFLRLELSP